MRAAGLDTHRLRSDAFWNDAFVMCGSEAPLAAGQADARLLPARNASAAAVRRSVGSNNSCEKSSATEQPGRATPAAGEVLAGEKPSG